MSVVSNFTNIRANRQYDLRAETEQGLRTDVGECRAYATSLSSDAKSAYSSAEKTRHQDIISIAETTRGDVITDRASIDSLPSVKDVISNGLLHCASYNQTTNEIELSFRGVDGNDNVTKISLGDLLDTETPKVSRVCGYLSNSQKGEADNKVRAIRKEEEVAAFRGVVSPLCSPLRFRGSVERKENLPNNAEIGTVYNTFDGINHVYTKDGWIELNHQNVSTDSQNADEKKSFARKKRSVVKTANTYFSSIRKNKRKLIRV